MSNPFIGEIRMFGGTFAPAGWSFCSGQLMPISQNDALFTLIGTTFGGDGQETFGIPDLQGRIPVHQGTNPGTGTSYQIGEKAGTESVTLTTNQIPIHNHGLVVSSAVAQGTNPQGSLLGQSTQAKLYIDGLSPNQSLNTQDVAPSGGSQPHDNMQPYLTINFIISLFGIFPSQN